MQQNLVSKGFRIGQANNANAGVTVDVKEFNAKVEQGNLRYTLNSKNSSGCLCTRSTRTIQQNLQCNSFTVWRI